MNRESLLSRHSYAFFIACFLFFLQVKASHAQPITVEPQRYQIDNSLKLIVCNQLPEFPSGQPLPTLLFDKEYTFTQPVSAFEVGKSYKVKNGNTQYTLYFTGLPLIEINTQDKETISNTDERTKGSFTLANGNEALFTSHMGIRIRGNISRRFPKKSYNMELWKDPEGDEELETSLLNLRKDSKWFLLALYNEPLRLTNATSHDLWLNMHKLYYAAQEADANSAIRTKYCDVFINNAYAGVYLFTEPMDRKQLKLKKSGDNGEVRGELYKADGWSEATTFDGLPSLPGNATDEVWAAWEMDYPDPYWNNLYEQLKYVVNSPAEDFKAALSGKFKVDNLIDYFIFLNMVNATDNFGNNQFLARYKENEPYFFIPWDLDGTFGYTTTGERGEQTRNITSNGLFKRLLTLDPDGFKGKMRKRWFALRKNYFSSQNLKNKVGENYNLLTAQGAYERESMKWSGTVKTSDLSKVNTWIENRLNFLDEYFALFPSEEPGTNLNYFHGEAITEGKILKWSFLPKTTAQQVEVEYSPDGVNFSSLTTIPVDGDTGSPQTYEFIHEDVSALAFYRLKIQTGDQLFTYTPFLQIGTNTCAEAPAAPAISTNLTDITEGQTAVLSASGCNQTVVWSTGQTGQSITVKPEVTAVYTAWCRQEIGCESPASASVKVNVFPNGSLPGNFEGYLGGIDCSTVRGWAWNRNKPNTAIYVEILDGQQVIATAIADFYRPELKTAGKGNGMHAFVFSVPETLKDNQVHAISARVLGTAYILKDSPKKITCKGTFSTPPVNQPPVKPPVSPLLATVETPFTAILPAFSDPDSPSLSYTLTGLPESLSFTASTRTVQGTPTETATLSLTYTASDGALSTTVLVQLTIGDGSTPPPPPVTVTGNFEGYLDKVECGTIRGWVWDRNKPNEPFMVEFFANGQSIGTAKADIFRQDLLNARKGNGNHVYSFTTPNEVKTGQTFQISAKVQNSNYTLTWSPKTLNCAPNARLGASAEIMDSPDGFLVTPNPTHGEFDIHFYSATATVTELSVVDESGRSWYKKTVQGIGHQKHKVLLSGTSGIYVVGIRQGEQVRSKKILLVR